MKIQLQRGPVPLFHQIAEALRYRIATGRLKAGDRLPSVRQAAADWGVNLHTVRRAYSELSAEGLVQTRAPNGTHVTDSGARGSRSPAEVNEFLTRTIEEAGRDHGLSVDRLVALLRERPHHPIDPPKVHFIECSLAQARGHCREIEDLWEVRALPWSLDRAADGLPEGNLLATYFHYSEIKAQWPDRLDDLRFVPIRPDAALGERIPRSDSPTTLRVCEIDEAKLLHIVSDLHSMIPEQFQLEACLVSQADELLKSKNASPILLSPRLWGALTPEQQTDPRVFEIRYIIEADSLEALGRHFNWSSSRKGPS